jgi:hypothetical protein
MNLRVRRVTGLSETSTGILATWWLVDLAKLTMRAAAGSRSIFCGGFWQTKDDLGGVFRQADLLTALAEF